MHQVTPTSNRPYGNKVQQQITLVCVTGSRPPSLGSIFTQSALENLDPYTFPPVAILGKVVVKLREYPCRRIILFAPGWLNMPRFWDLVAMSSQIPLCMPNLLTQPFNQIPAIQSDSRQESVELKSPCMAPRASPIKEQGFSEAVAA